MQIEVFKIEISLGNAAMQNSTDVAECLERLAMRLRADNFRAATHLFDVNGNCVGHSKIVNRRC